MSSLIFIDFSNLALRAFHSAGMSSPDDRTLLMSRILRMLKKIKFDYPDYDLVCVFDGSKATSLIRDHLFSSYKESRRVVNPSPLEEVTKKLFFQDMSLLYRHLPFLGIQCLMSDYLEADLVIAAQVSKKPNRLTLYPTLKESLVLSADVDYATMIRATVSWLRPTQKKNVKGLLIRYDRAVFHREFGITPNMYPYVKLLLGDKSDGVSGVRGLGKVKSLKKIRGICLAEKPKTQGDLLSALSRDLGLDMTDLRKKMMLFDLSKPGILLEFLVSKIPNNVSLKCFFEAVDASPSYKQFRNFCKSGQLPLSDQEYLEFARVFLLNTGN